MSIEESLATLAATSERAAAALERLAAAMEGGHQVDTAFPDPAEEPVTKKPATKKTEKPADPEPEPVEESDPLDEGEEKAEVFTEDQVRKALKDYRDINGTDATMVILAKYGAKGMGSLKPEDYAAVMEAVR